MSTAAHTPGPWVVGPLNANGERIVGAHHFEIVTCWHHCVGSIEREMEANAHLIAAAPEMLAVLNTVRIMLKNRDQTIQEMKLLDAIKLVVAKAEGRS